MNKTCSKCGRKAKKGEMFSIFVDPESDWWVTLFDKPLYCKNCAKEVERRRDGKGTK